MADASDSWGLCGLSSAIAGRLDSVIANAAAAEAELDRVLSEAGNSGSPDVNASFNARCDELRADLAMALRTKTSALEAELVAVDSALEFAGTASASATSTRVLAEFGVPPLEPYEPAYLALVLDAPGSPSIGRVVSPRAVVIRDLGLRGLPPARMVRWGRTLRFDVMLSADSKGWDTPLARRVAAESLASRLRVSATLLRKDGVETAGTGAEYNADGSPSEPRLLSLAPAVVALASGEGASVNIALPPLVPGDWILRVDRFSLGAASLEINPLASGIPVIERPPPGPVRPPGALLNACRRGDIAAIRLILAGPDDAYSTEETTEGAGNLADSVRYRGFTCLWWAADRGCATSAQLLIDAGANVRLVSYTGGTLLSLAAFHGHCNVLRLLLDNPHVDVDRMIRYSLRSVLHAAVVGGHVEAVNMVLADPRVDVNARDRNGDSPLALAVSGGNVRMAQLLLSHARVLRDPALLRVAACRHGGGDESSVKALLGVLDDVNVRGPGGDTALAAAAKLGHERVVRALLSDPRVTVEAGALLGVGSVYVVRLLLAHPAVDVNARTPQGCTPILFAARNGHTAIIEALMAHGGVDVNARGPNGTTPLIEAARYDRIEAVLELLKHPQVDVNAWTVFGVTALAVAARLGFTAIVRALLSDPRVAMNASPDASLDGSTPLHEAVSHRRGEIVSLLASSPRVDVCARNRRSHTPLIVAARIGCIGAIRGLTLASGPSRVQVNAATADGSLSPLLCAASHARSSEAMCRLLLAIPGVDANIRGSQDITPLIAAAKRSLVDTVRLLLAHPGVDAAAATTTGFTALHGAAYGGHEHVVQSLLAVPDVDPNAPTRLGITPLLGAAYRGRVGVVRLLLADARVNLHAVSLEGETALETARRRGKAEVVALLEADSRLAPPPLPSASETSSSGA